MLSNLQMWSAIVGFLLPPVVSVVNQAHWSGGLKLAVAALVSALVGGVTAALTGQLTGKTWTQAALIVVTAAIGAYQLAWKPSGVADHIEQATTRAPSE